MSKDNKHNNGDKPTLNFGSPKTYTDLKAEREAAGIEAGKATAAQIKAFYEERGYYCPQEAIKDADGYTPAMNPPKRARRKRKATAQAPQAATDNTRDKIARLRAKGMSDTEIIDLMLQAPVAPKKDEYAGCPFSPARGRKAIPSQEQHLKLIKYALKSDKTIPDFYAMRGFTFFTGAEPPKVAGLLNAAEKPAALVPVEKGTNLYYALLGLMLPFYSMLNAGFCAEFAAKFGYEWRAGNPLPKKEKPQKEKAQKEKPLRLIRGTSERALLSAFYQDTKSPHKTFGEWAAAKGFTVSPANANKTRDDK